MRALCGLLVLLALGLVSGTAVAGLSGSVAPGAITGTLSVTTVVPTDSVPTVTVSLPVTTVTSPTTVPTLPVTVTVPTTTAVTLPTTTAPLPVTTTVPPVTTSVPPVTATAPPVTTVTRVTTTSRSGTAPVPVPVTTGASSTAPGTAGAGPTRTTAVTAPTGAPSATAPAARVDQGVSRGATPVSASAIGPGDATRDGRAIVLTFRLDRPRPVRITVVRAVPQCRLAGSFVIRGRTGTNTLRFDGTLGAQRLRAGVYEVRVDSPDAVRGRIWVRISASGRLSILEPRTACPAPAGSAGSLGAPWAPQPPTTGAGSGPRAGIASARYSTTGSEGGDARSPHGLASDLPRNPLGVLLLGLAALLVAIAALPRRAIPAGRLGALVADRKVELVSVGATVFVTAVLTLGLA